MPTSSLFLRSSTTFLSAASLFSSVLAVPAISPRQAGPIIHYELQKSYQGSSFFDGFSFFDQADPTHGFVTYGNRKYAEDNQLIGFEGDYAVLKIDSTTNLGKGHDYYANQPDQGRGEYWLQNNVGRKSLRIEGTYEFTKGLIITDIGQMPSGVCGAWPAFWTLGRDQWPKDGEIDIVEGAHTQGGFWSALHTEGESNINNNRDSFSGRITAPDCQVRLDSPNPNWTGCKIEDSDRSTWDTYGGGVWATQWTSERIKIWFWPYGSVPADVQSGNPSPGSLWGTPRASYAPPANLRAEQNFRNHHIIFDTTFCGDLGDATWASSGCAGRTGYTTCADFVANTPGAFENAKWKVKYVKIYGETTPVSSSSSSSVASSTSSVHSSTSSVQSSTSSAVVSTSSSISSVHSSSSSAAASSSSSLAPLSSSASSAAPSLPPSVIPSSLSSSIYSHIVTSTSTYAFPSTRAGNYSISHGSGPRTSSRGSGGHNGGYDGGDDGGYNPKPTTSSKVYDGGYDGGHGAYSSKPPASSSKPYQHEGDGGYGEGPVPTSSKAWYGNGGYGDNDEEQCVTSTYTTTTKIPCATPPYWEEVTTTITATKTIIVKPTPHVEHGGDYPPKSSKNAVVLPSPSAYVPHVEIPEAPSVPVKPASPSKGYDTPASPVAPGKDYGHGSTPAAPVSPSKAYGAADSWPLAGASPTGNKYQPSSAYGAKPSQFTGGASSNAVIGGGFIAVALGAVVAVW